MTELLPRHTLWFVPLSFLLLSVVGCASSHDRIEPVRGVGPEACVGNPSHYAPIVCVDDNFSTLPADPDVVYAVNPPPAGRRPTVIEWFTVTGTNQLLVTFKSGNEGCTVRQPRCDGPHCVAVVKPDAGAGMKCKYTIQLINKPGYYNDPTVEIDACCPLF